MATFNFQRIILSSHDPISLLFWDFWGDLVLCSFLKSSSERLPMIVLISTRKCATRLRKRWGEAPRSRLAGAGFKPPQAALVKSQGGERWRKRHGRRPCQVRFRETSASEPSMRCRNEKDDARTGGLPNSRISPRETCLLLGRRPA